MVVSVSNRESVRQSFLRESAYFRFSSPLFSALARSCAGDEDMLDLATATRPGQSAGQLLPCVAQYLLLQSPQHQLGAYFPSITSSPGPAEAAFPAFREFCLDRRDAVQELLSWRTVNTNLVEKASTLLPAFAHVASLAKEPLTLLEICCSAGLNMLFDEYHYDYGAQGQVGAESSPVQLECRVVTRRRPPIDSIPVIAHRMGVDLVKVDAAAALDRLWMEAVLFPEWTAERKRLRAALELRQTRQIEMQIGDALYLLPPLLEKLPGTLCILQTYCINHWSTESRIALEELLCRAGKQREIHRIALEMPDSEPPANARSRLAKLAAAGVPLLRKSFPSRLEHTLYTNGTSRTHLLAEGDGFGVWLDWHGGES